MATEEAVAGRYDLGVGDPDFCVRVLGRVVAEWRAVRGKLALPNSATIREVGERLHVGYAVAQRLNRIGKIVNVTSDDLKYFPSPRTWEQIVTGVERVLGADHPSYQTFSLAVDRFGSWIDAAGGSRSAAMRAENSRTAENAASSGAGSAASRPTERGRFVDLWGSVFGYLIDTRLSLQIARQTTDDPDRLDVATLNALLGCRGRPGAMPLAFTGAVYGNEQVPVERAEGDQPKVFHVLSSVRTTPMPAILSTADAFRQTVFVEPQWTSQSRPLDFGVMHQIRGVMYWDRSSQWIEFAMLNVHPCKRLILEKVVPRDIDATCAAALQVFRTHILHAHDEPWYDRIPDDTPVARVGTVDDAMADEPFDGYAAILSEAVDRLQWDTQDMVVYRAVIENPIPMANYTVMFDRT